MEDDSCLRLNYRLTTWMLLRGHWLLNARRIIIVFCGYLVLSVVAVASAWGDRDFWTAIGLIAFGGLLLLWAYVVTPWLHSRAWVKEPSIAGDLVLMVDEEGLRGGNGIVESRYDWSSFSRFIEGGSLFVLRIGKRMAAVIPKSAFSSDEDIERFSNLARRHVGGG